MHCWKNLGNILTCHVSYGVFNKLIDGYGRQLFEKFHSLNPLTPAMLKRSYFPLTLGRDFSGIVRSTGGNVVKVKPGDHVMGVVPPPLSGSHSQYLVSSCSNIVLKPPHLSMEEATSIPYAGLTAWSALSITAELCVGSRGKQVLVLGASGGVGSIAVQLLKSWGSSVTNFKIFFLHQSLPLKCVFV